MDTSLAGKRILVTGGLGYIGKHVVKAFVEAGAEYVEIWDTKKLWHRAGPNYEGIAKLTGAGYNGVDIFEHTGMIDYYMRENHFHVVVNLAAIADVPSCALKPELAYDVNVSGLEHIIRLSNVWNALLLHADSAMSSFGTVSTYAYTKSVGRDMINENRAKGYSSHCMTLYNVVGADPDAVFGEDHDPETHFLPNLVNASLLNTPFKLDKNINVRRDFVHVSDVADAFVQAAQMHIKGQLPKKNFEVGTGIETSLVELVDFVQQMDESLMIEEVETDRWEPLDNGIVKFSASKNEVLPGWVPQFSVREAYYHQLRFKKASLPIQ